MRFSTPNGAPFTPGPEIGPLTIIGLGVLALLCGMLAGAASAQTTTYTGTIKDLSGAVVTSGQVTFTLAPAVDSTSSGNARFVPSTVTCSLTTAGTLQSQGGGPCAVAQNTALNPTGTSYRVCIQPYFAAPGSCFYDYATVAAKDISTVAPTLSTGPLNYGGIPGPPGGPSVSLFVGPNYYSTIQAAVTKACTGFGLVTILPNAAPSDTIATAVGCRGATIRDHRPSQLQNYVWSATSPTSATQFVGVGKFTRMFNSQMLYVTGTSIDFGYVNTNPATARWSYQLSQHTGQPITVNAVPGDMACDAWPRQFQPIISLMEPNLTQANAYSVSFGTNEIFNKGVGAYEATYETCLGAFLSYLAVPREDKVLAGDVAFTAPTGTNSPGIYGPASATIANFAYATSPGSYQQTIYTTGNPLYIWQYLRDGASGSFTVTIDGANVGTFSTAPATPMATVNGTVASVGLTGRFPVAAGQHTVVETWVSGVFGIVGIGSVPAQPYYSAPTILVGQVPNSQQSTTNPTITSMELQYTADAAAVMSPFVGDGADLRMVFDRAYMLGGAGEMNDNSHPTVLGQLHLAQAWEEAMQIPSMAQYAAAVGTNSTQLITVTGTTVGQGISTVLSYDQGAGSITVPLPTLAVPTNSNQRQITFSNLPASIYNLTLSAGSATVATCSGSLSIRPGSSITLTAYGQNNQWYETDSACTLVGSSLMQLNNVAYSVGAMTDVAFATPPTSTTITVTLPTSAPTSPVLGFQRKVTVFVPSGYGTASVVAPGGYTLIASSGVVSGVSVTAGHSATFISYVTTSGLQSWYEVGSF